MIDSLLKKLLYIVITKSRETSGSEDSQSECTAEYAHEIIDEWLILEVDESLIRV